MEPLRLIFDNLPEVLTIPQDFQHKKVEVIFWPLEKNIFDVQDDILSFFGCITDFPDRDFQGEPELRLGFE
jgi:hypothetical protein